MSSFGCPINFPFMLGQLPNNKVRTVWWLLKRPFSSHSPGGSTFRLAHRRIVLKNLSFAFVNLSLFLTGNISADVGTGDSSLFPLDTRYGLNIAEGVSQRFILDTRLSGSSVSADSVDFMLDTRGTEVANSRVSGRVTDGAGNMLFDVNVTATSGGVLRANTTSDLTGNYQLPLLPPGIYEIRASKPGWLTGLQPNLAISASNPASIHFKIEPRPSTPPTQTVTRAVEPGQDSNLHTATSTQLKLYRGNSFQSDQKFDRFKPTLVMTHGWNSNPGAWAEKMAAALVASGVDANIAAWEWETAAKALPLPPVDETPEQGLTLGQALLETLGEDYAQKIQFLGHSLGTLVNARAANYLHGDGETDEVSSPTPWEPTRTHITMFDEAEAASLAGQKVLATAEVAAEQTFVLTAGGVGPAAGAGAIALVVTSYADWKSPIPRRTAWIDNYITEFGLFHKSAVNVFLRQGLARSGFNGVTYHSYPMVWYEQTVNEQLSALMGFGKSFTRLGELPPLGRYQPNTAYLQPLFSKAEFGLEFVGEGSTLDNLRLQGLQMALALPALGVAGVDFGAHAIGDLAVVAVDTTGAVVVDVAEKISAHFDGTLNPLADPTYGVGASTPAVIGVTNYRPPEALTEWTLQLQFTTQPVLRDVGPQSVGKSPQNNVPAYAWLTVVVPTNAALLSFDLMLRGDGKNDSVVFGANGTNLFSLQTKFLAEGVTVNSGLRDISTYAGRTVELFFGVLGGTSTNAQVTVDAIRFHQIVPPNLVAASNGEVATVSWPTSAGAFVLESTLALAGINEWTAVTNAPAVVDAQYTLTNDASGARFFRLRKL